MTRSLPLGILDFTSYVRTCCRNGLMDVVADFYICTSVEQTVVHHRSHYWRLIAGTL
jgi:hypothetical protein